MSLIVQKFGGTSLGRAERLQQVANIIRETVRHHTVIVVVSAMSSYKKSEGITSRLLQAGEYSIAGKDYSKIIELIENTHFDVLEETIHSVALRNKVEADIHEELQHLKSFLEAIRVIQEISPRSQDLIVGTGERLSAQVLTGILEERGIESEYVNLSEIAPAGLEGMDPHFTLKLQKLITRNLSGEPGKIPVVTGFFGFVTEGIIAGVGRGYSDFTAALIATRFRARELQIWKEVDGVFTADPNKVPAAKVLDHIYPNEAAELTYFGSEVLHPFTMECAMAGAVPIRIKNTFAPEKPGTVIIPQKDDADAFHEQLRPERTAVAVTAKSDITVVNIYSNRMLNSPGFMAKVFEIFKKHRIVIDLVSTSEVNISCTVDRRNGLSEMQEDLSKLGKVSIIPQRAILSLVGENMKHVPGVAGRMFSALARNNINIEMITQGASEINISCVVKQEDALEALQLIHHTFLEAPDES